MTAEDPIIGAGHGIEHLLIVVRNLATAVGDYQKNLGFQITPGTKLPDGIENATIELHGEEYLELLTTYEGGVDSPNAKEVRQLLSHGEGACGFGIQVSSAEAAADHIRSRGFDVVGPSESEFTPPGFDSSPVVTYRNLRVKSGEPALDEVLFFTEPQRDTISQLQKRYPDLWPTFGTHLDHPNTAIGKMRPWLAVSDFDRVTELYAAVGFPKLRDERLERWNCDAREFKIGSGTLMLLEAGSSSSGARGFLGQRGTSYSVAGVTLAAASVSKFESAVAAGARSRLQPATGLHGPSILVPPDLTHGVWLELVGPAGSPS